MKESQPALNPNPIDGLIREIRGQKVILDSDLARLYGVETRALNQAIKRNLGRFPADFMFGLDREEIMGMSQSVISLRRLKYSKGVHAFTEHGAIMAANIQISEDTVPYRISRKTKP